MKQNTITWSEVSGSGRASFKGVIFPLDTKPVLSFAFDGLYYEDTLSMYVEAGKSIDLSQAQKDELDSFIYNLYLTTGQKVHAYDSNFYYMGFIVPGTATIAGTVPFGPPTENERYRFDPTYKRWILIAGVDQNGVYLGCPVQLSDTRFYKEVTSTPPNPYDVWDFTANAWKDGRTLDQIKQALVDQLNQAAGEARARYITIAPGQDAVYELKAQEATRFQSDPNPVATNYPHLYAEVGITAADLAGVAQTILNIRSQWIQKSAGIEGQRIGGGKNIKAAADAKAAKGAFNTAYANLLAYKA